MRMRNLILTSFVTVFISAFAVGHSEALASNENHAQNDWKLSRPRVHSLDHSDSKIYRNEMTKSRTIANAVWDQYSELNRLLHQKNTNGSPARE